MNSKHHLYLSFLKSFIRIMGCAFSILHTNWVILAVAFLIAEIPGIFEEIKDER